MDRAALEALYHALRGPAWDGKPSWGTDAPLGEWTGVSVEDGRVVGLRFGLVKELRGSLPPEMGDLGALRVLHINATGLTGPLPPELGKLALLEELRLPWNMLTGEIPPEFGGLTSLETLLLDRQCSHRGHSQGAGVASRPQMG